MTTQATRLLDAQTVLVGWINHSATDCYEHSRSSGDVINLGTDLDASGSFVLVASHPGHNKAVTVTLELAPLLALPFLRLAARWRQASVVLPCC